MQRMRVVILAALVVVGVAGCGGSSTNETQPPAATEAPATEKPAELSAEQRKKTLEVGLLRAADLGADWAEAPPDTPRSLDVDTVSDQANESACAPLLKLFGELPPSEKSQSPLFAKGSFNAQNSVTVFDQPGVADKLVTTLNRIDPAECFQKAFNAAYARELTKIVNDGSQLTGVQVRKRQIAPVGDNRFALEISLKLSKGDASREINLTRVSVKVGQSILDYSLVSENYPFPKVDEVIKPSVDRVENCAKSVALCNRG